MAAPGLEKPRQLRRPAPPRVAAILRRFEHRAWVVAAAGDFQHGWALADDVAGAADGLGAAIRGGAELHGHVEPFHDGDIVVVLLVERVQPVLRQRVRRRPVRLALELPVAVSGQAPAAARGVEGAVGSGPDFGQMWAVGQPDGPRLARIEAAPTPRDGGGPEGVGAVVLYGEDDCMGLEEEEREERESDGFGGNHFFFFTVLFFKKLGFGMNEY